MQFNDMTAREQYRKPFVPLPGLAYSKVFASDRTYTGAEQESIAHAMMKLHSPRQMPIRDPQPKPQQAKAKPVPRPVWPPKNDVDYEYALARVVTLARQNVSRAHIAMRTHLPGAVVDMLMDHHKRRLAKRDHPQRMRREDAEQILRDMAARGATHRDVADVVGVSTRSVGKWARHYGITFAPRPRAEHIAYHQALPRLRQYAEQGASAVEVAEALGIARSTVNTWGTRAGLRFSDPRKCDDKTIAAIMALLATGLTMCEVAAQTGVSQATVSRVAARQRTKQ